jgi:hypothetical protein
MASPLAQFEALLASQHGLVTLAQLRKGELSEGQRQRLVDSRILRRVRPRVFAVVGGRETWERGLLAVVLSVEGAVASHSAAARLWGFQPRPEDRYEITVERKHRTEVRGVAFHSSCALDEDVVTRDDISCTSFERTLADCTTLMSEWQLGRALDDGLRRGIASLARLAKCSARLESGPGRHMSVVRSLLAARGIGFDPGGSRSELQLLDVWRRAGVPSPVQQHRIRIGSKTYRPDFAWPAEKVVAEFYGLAFHIGANAVVDDSRRLTALSSAGWLPLVFTHASPDREIVDRVVEALHHRRVVGVLSEER